MVVIPKANLEKPIEEEHRNFYDKNELMAFLDAIKLDENIKWYLFFRVLAFTGIRKGEALALTWKDIDFKKNQIIINKTLTLGEKNQLITQTPKTKSGKRTVSLDANTVMILKEWKKEQKEQNYMLGIDGQNLVFHTSTDTYIPLPQPGHVVNRICKKHDLRRISVHGFRHTHCSLLFEAGMSLKEVQDRLGHSDIKTTMNIYTHVTQKKRDDIAERFAEFVDRL